MLDIRGGRAEGVWNAVEPAVSVGACRVGHLGLCRVARRDGVRACGAVGARAGVVRYAGPGSIGREAAHPARDRRVKAQPSPSE